MSIKRYDFELGSFDGWNMVDAKDGEYIKFKDHQKAMTEAANGFVAGLLTITASHQKLIESAREVVLDHAREQKKSKETCLHSEVFGCDGGYRCRACDQFFPLGDTT